MSREVFLESERLFFRPLGIEYYTDVYLRWLNDPEVNLYLEIRAPYSEQQLKDYLKAVEEDKELLFWAIHLKGNRKHIGNIKIDPVNTYHGYGEYGIMMGDREEWGKGYAKEASARILEFCFAEIGLRKINLGVVAENQSAVNLYRKLGFGIEGIYKQHGWYNGHYCDLFRMAIFNPDKRTWKNVLS
jgi:[ribosomal protein S5]-alanine N-acetyltransferase